MQPKRFMKTLLSAVALTLLISGCSLFPSGSGGGSTYTDPFAPEDVVDGMFYTVNEEEGYAVFNGIYDNLAFNEAYRNANRFEVRSEYKGYPVRVILDNALTDGNCASIEEIAIPSSVKSIGFRAFRSCRNVTKIVFNEGLEAIGEEAFYEYGNERRVEFTLPSTLKKIGNSALPCSTQTLVMPPRIEELGNGCLKYNTFDELYLPGTLKELGADVFAQARARYLHMSDEITTLPENAFEAIQGVETIHLSNALTILPKKTFHWMNDETGMSDPVEITGGESIEEIHSEACNVPSIRYFPYSNVLRNISGENSLYYVKNRNFPDSLRSISATAFHSAADNTPGHYPSQIGYVPDNLFARVQFDQTDIEIHLSNQSSIGEYSFANSNLTKVTIDAYNFEIKRGAFSNCSDLEQIYFTDTMSIFRNTRKGEDWNKGVKATCVHCSDGDLYFD